MSTQTQAKPLFAARLTPQRPLSSRGLRVALATIVVGVSLPLMAYWAREIWPVACLLAADALALWWALGRPRPGAGRFEEITLWRDQLEFRQVDGAGRETLTRFNPHLVKLVVDRDYNERTTGLHLRTSEQDVELGVFLGQDEKSSFAKAFGTALKRARH